MSAARNHPLLSHAEEIALAQDMDRARACIARHAGAVPGVVSGYLAALSASGDRRRGRIYLGTTLPEEPPAEAGEPPVEALRAAAGDAQASARVLGDVRPSEEFVERWAEAVRDSALGAEAKRSAAQALRRLVRARNALVSHNLRLVVSLAKRQHRPEGYALSDVIGDGNHGLIQAVRLWQYKHGFRFSTYATWWIRQSVSRSVQERARTVRAPTPSRQRRERIAEGRPSPEDRLAGAALLPAISMDAPLGPGTQSTLHDVMPGGAPAEDALTSPGALFEAIERAVEEMEPAQADLLRRRYGMDGRPAASLREMGEALGRGKKAVTRDVQLALDELRRRIQG